MNDEELFRRRNALVTHPDSRARRAALLELTAADAARLVAYVRDATCDPSLQVREAAFAALGRAHDPESLEPAQLACERDRSFRVRRMAILSAARIHGLKALPLLRVAAKDPFWRVRVAARQAGLSLGVSLDIAPEEPAWPQADLGELHDDDPAVVTARLRESPGRIAAHAFIGLLGHSHRALRQLAVNALRAETALTRLREVLVWLEDERVPYGPRAAEAALGQNEHSSAQLAELVLQERPEASPGALSWALGAARDLPPWEVVEQWLEHADGRVRRAAVRRVPELAPDPSTLWRTVERLLHVEDAESRCFTALWVARSRTRAGQELLAALPTDRQPTAVRALIAAAATSLGAREVLQRLTRDAHGAVQAAALRGLVGLGVPIPEPPNPEDPWIREALLCRRNASTALRDSSPVVRRTALALLAPEEGAAWAEGVSAASEPDAWLRARAAEVLATAHGAQATRRLLVLSRDVDLGVRSAALASLASHTEGALALLQEGVLEPGERIAAHTLLGAAAAAARTEEREPSVLEHIELLDAVDAGRAPATSPSAATSPRAKPQSWRALGNTGIWANPFALSGAHGLTPDQLSAAQDQGVNLFFWEPGYLDLARFLRAERGQSALVATGTYHADAEAIERDVARALRSLRRDALDVFLAFWTRSSARLDQVTDALQALLRRGHARAVGISTHDRALALAASARGLNVVMVRHSAAHRGAEAAVFPECQVRGTAVLTFSNLCYGRMLHRSPAVLSAKVTAPDCYRYSLSQPGVSACIAAPRRHSELVENLVVAADPSLGPERMAELRRHGDHVYARSKAWAAEAWQEPLAPRSGISSSPERIEDWLERPGSLCAEA